jgi:hypothetical protein
MERSCILSRVKSCVYGLRGDGISSSNERDCIAQVIQTGPSLAA